MTLELILLYVIAGIAVAISIAALKAAHDARVYAEDLADQIVERFTALEVSLPKTSDHYPIFDLLDKKIDQQARRIAYIDNKHEHLHAVVMEKILTEAEDAETV